MPLLHNAQKWHAAWHKLSDVSKQKFPEIQPPSSLDRGFFHDIVLRTVEAVTYPCKSPSDASSEC
jgi:hypothetical protein